MIADTSHSRWCECPVLVIGAKARVLNIQYPSTRVLCCTSTFVPGYPKSCSASPENVPGYTNTSIFALLMLRFPAISSKLKECFGFDTCSGDFVFLTENCPRYSKPFTQDSGTVPSRKKNKNKNTRKSSGIPALQWHDFRKTAHTEAQSAAAAPPCGPTFAHK